MENILQFSTASKNEPVLGYAVTPRTEFALSLFPTANMCINKLTLVIGDKLPADQEIMFNVFDLAFLNSHFGLI